MELMRLLLVEDDGDLSDFVREGMTRVGFTVDVTADGESALRLTEAACYDVILLDVMLPKLDGYSVLKTLRARGYKGAILLVTSKGHEKDKLEGFNRGADDYIVKPFILTELVARVRAVVRRTAGAYPQTVKGSVLRVGDLEMDLLKYTVKRAGKPIDLTKKEFALLEVFMRHPGEVLSPTVICQKLFHADINTHTNIIEVHVKNLRDKLDHDTGPSLIRTSRGFGYALDV
jgi:DNA-binding response OmpR family regulator